MEQIQEKIELKIKEIQEAELHVRKLHDDLKVLMEERAALLTEVTKPTAADEVV